MRNSILSVSKVHNPDHYSLSPDFFVFLFYWKILELSVEAENYFQHFYKNPQGGARKKALWLIVSLYLMNGGGANNTINQCHKLLLEAGRFIIIIERGTSINASLALPASLMISLFSCFVTGSVHCNPDTRHLAPVPSTRSQSKPVSEMTRGDRIYIKCFHLHLSGNFSISFINVLAPADEQGE